MTQLRSPSTDNLLTSRKKLSFSVEDLQRDSCDFTEREMQWIKEVYEKTADKIPIMGERCKQISNAILQLRRVQFTLRYGIQFGIYAVKWDPTKVENYENLLVSLDSFENLIDQLQSSLERISEDKFLQAHFIFIKCMVLLQET